MQIPVPHLPDSPCSLMAPAEFSSGALQGRWAGRRPQGRTGGSGECPAKPLVLRRNRPGSIGRIFFILAVLPALVPAICAAGSDRIAIANGQFVVGDRRIWINGANTPWNAWNDFGGRFDAAWWDAQFQALRDHGINATRVWITCDGEVGIDIDDDGRVAGATPAHWADLDQLFQIAAKHRVYVMATLMSFDHFKNSHAHFQRWRNWIARDANIDSYVDHYLTPFLDRYGSSPWLWSIDLMNEPDWVFENANNGRVSWERLQDYFGRAARAIHDRSPVLVTVGMAMLKYNSDTGRGCLGNQVSDRALRARVDVPGARLDFYSTHYYDWNGALWGNAASRTPGEYKLPVDKPGLLGELPAKGTAGHTIGEDYDDAFQHGWQGVMAWTSNGVDENGSLQQLGPATRAFREHHASLVEVGGR